jgi:hypothetical protein
MGFEMAGDDDDIAKLDANGADAGAAEAVVADDATMGVEMESGRACVESNVRRPSLNFFEDDEAAEEAGTAAAAAAATAAATAGGGVVVVMRLGPAITGGASLETLNLRICGIDDDASVLRMSPRKMCEYLRGCDDVDDDECLL